METGPDCYGKRETCGNTENCPSCEFLESCRYFTRHDDKKINRGSGHVSFERYSYSSEIADRPAESEEELFDSSPESGSGKYTDQDMIRLMEFMLRIDDYSLSLVENVISRNIITASDAARVYKVSRQAVHRKLLDSCRKYPELRMLFRASLYRCKRLRDDIDSPPRQQNQNLQQMELF